MKSHCLCPKPVFALTFCLTLMGISLQAQVTWDGGGGDTNWATADNWAGNIAPTAGSPLIFTGDVQTTSNNTLANGTIINGIQFTNDGSTAETSGEFVLSGNSVTLSSGLTTTAVVPADTTLTDTINFDIILNGNRTFTANGNAANNTEHNLILNGDISGAFQLLTAGDATITFAGNNTFTSFRLGDGSASTWNGTTGTRAGFVVVNNNGALGTGQVTSSGGQLQAGVSGINLANDFNVSVGGLRVGGSNDFELSGAITQDETRNYANYGTGTVTLSGGLAGPGDFIKEGSGTVRFQSVAPSFTGAQYVNEGTLLYFGNAIDDNSNEANNTAVIAAGATLEFNTNGTNKNIAAFDFSGGGTFKKSGNGQFSQVSGGSNITLTASGLVHVTGGSYSFGGQTPGDWSSNLGSLQIDTGATFEGRATGIRADVLSGEGTMGIGGKSSGDGLREGLTLGVANGSGTFNGVIKNTTNWGGGYGTQGAVEFTLIKAGTGTQTLNGDNTYTGDTTISGGLLNINGTNVSNFNVGTGSNIGGEGSTTGDITFQGTTHTLDVNGLTSAALGSTGTGTLDVSAVGTGGFTVNVSGVASDITVLTYGSGGFTGNLNAFTLGSNTTGSRGFGGFANDVTNSAIKVDLGYADNTWTGAAGSNWDLNNTANWNNSSDSIFLNLDDATFGDTGVSNFTPTLEEDITASRVTFENNTNDYSLGSDNGSRVLTSNNGFDFNGSGDVTVNVELSGAAGLTQSGSGTTTLSSTNGYTSTTTIGNGTIVANAANAFGTSGNITFTGGTLQFTENGATADYGARIKNSTGIILDSNGQDVTLSGSIDNSNSGGLTKNGTGQLTITAARNYTGTTTVNEGTLTLRGAAIGTSKSYAPIANGAILEFDSTGTSANGGTITLNGSGTFKKSGTNGFNITSAGSNVAQSSGGLFHVAAGTYVFGGAGLGTWASNLGDMKIDAGATYEGRASHIIIDALNGDGTIGIGGTSAAASGVGLRLGVDNGTGVFGGTIQNTSSNGALFTLEKVGSGTQTLNGNNTYTGDTTISGGQLNINGTNVSSFNVGVGGNIGGEGATSGNIVFAGTTHTLDVNALTSAALGSTGTGTLDVSAVGTGGFTVNVSGVASDITVLTYGSGGFTGDLNAFTLGSNTTGSRGFGGFTNDVTNSAIKVDLGSADNTWTGAAGSNWDLNNTANWNNSSDSLFFNLDEATFGDTATNFTATLVEDITASRVTFENNTNDYSLGSDNGSRVLTSNNGFDFTGSGDVTVNVELSGAASLTQSGTGTTTLSSTNSYTGNTSISGGALAINASEVLSDSADVSLTGGNFRMVDGTTETVNSFLQTDGTVGFGFTATGSQSGSSRLNVNGDSTFTNIAIGSAGTLGVAANVTATLTGSISQLGNNESFSFDIAENGQANVSAAINTGKGEGQINKSGAGILRLTANNSQYGGGNRFTNGTVEFTSIVNAGTDQSSSLGDADFQDVLQIGGDSTSATLRMIGTNSKNTSNRSVELGNGGGHIEVADAAQIFTLNGTVSGGALTVGPQGTVVLAGANTYTGGTTVTAGTLLLNNTTGSATGTGAVTVNSGATIGGSGTIGGAATISGTHSSGGSLANTSVAQQTVSGDLTYNAGSSVTWDLITNSNSNAGTDFDQFVVGGALDFSGSTTLNLNFDGGAVDWTDSLWDADQNWTIYSGASSLASANNLTLSFEDWQDSNGVLFSTARELPNGSSFYLDSSGDDLVLNFNAVPEPSTYALTGLGIVAFGWFTRKRRRKQVSEVTVGSDQ